jgi:hypothetical protein
VLVDRGHRVLPIRADYVGRTLATSRDEVVQVLVQEEDGRDEVQLLRKQEAPASGSPKRRRGTASKPAAAAGPGRKRGAGKGRR